MSRIVIFDPTSQIVENRVINYIRSAHTPDYSENTNALINPDVSLLSEIDWLYWKVNNGLVVEMSASEKIEIDNSQKNNNVGIINVPMLLVFSKNSSNIFNEYVNIDAIVSNKSSYNMIRNGTITGLSWSSELTAKQNGSIIIQNDDVNLVLTTVTTGDKQKTFKNLLYNFNENSLLKCYVSGCKVDNLIVLMEFVWRV